MVGLPCEPQAAEQMDLDPEPDNGCRRVRQALQVQVATVSTEERKSVKSPLGTEDEILRALSIAHQWESDKG